MAIVSFFVFGTALAVSAWVLWSTIAPQVERIVDLLVNGPVAAPAVPAPVAARSSIRDVRVRVVSSSRSPKRAAA